MNGQFQSRERILIGGESGSGKSTAVLSIVKHNLNVIAYVIEADDGITRVLEEFPEIKVSTAEAPTRFVKIPVCQDYSEFYNAVFQVQEWVKNGTLDASSWVITEAIDVFAYNTRYEFADRVYGAGTSGVDAQRAAKAGMASSAWDSFIKRRRSGNPILEPSDYDGIYTEFEKPLRYLAFQMPCNWIATSGLEELRTSGSYQDSQEVKDFYLSLGMTVKFSGYKRLPRMMDTLITMRRSITDGYTFTVWKDRGGQRRGSVGNKIVNHKHTDFWNDYFVSMVGYHA